jgi:formylglycine-generating enzyme required for sulfatase activity
MGYILTSAFELEIYELTQEEFAQLIEEKKKEENTENVNESLSDVLSNKETNEELNPELLIGNE